MLTYGRIAIVLPLTGALAAYAAICSSNCAADTPGPGELLSTKKVMDKCYVGNQSLMKMVRKDLERAQPDWASAEKNVTEVMRLMSMLTRQKPPRGSQEAWDGLVEDYLKKAGALKQNIKEQKPGASRASLPKIASTCDECHDNHGIQ